MSNVLTWKQCFAIKGNDSIIDMVNPDTGRSHVYGETLEQVRERCPGAELMNFDDLMKAKAADQDAEPREWKEVSKARYLDMLCVLPPAAMKSGAFLVGEAYDHHAGTGRPRFACFKCECDKHYELSCHITHAEFCRMFGQTSYDYLE